MVPGRGDYWVVDFLQGRRAKHHPRHKKTTAKNRDDGDVEAE